MNNSLNESKPMHEIGTQRVASASVLPQKRGLRIAAAALLSVTLAFSLFPIAQPQAALASEAGEAVAGSPTDTPDSEDGSSAATGVESENEPEPEQKPASQPTPDDGSEDDSKPAASAVTVNKSNVAKTASSSSAISVWLRKTSSIDGYEVAYSTDSKYAKYRTKKLNKTKTYVHITGLSAKTKYYVKVRCYKAVNGKKYYSDWSQTRSVDTTAKKKAKKGKPSLKASKVAKYMKKQVGKSGFNNMCLSFVEVSWIRLGTRDTRNIPCAYEYGKKYRISSSASIPIGADVYFSGGYSGCGGHRAGHVGIYIGNGYMVSALGGKIKKTKIRDYIYSGGGHQYYGWGYHKDVTIDSDILDTSTDAFGMVINLSPKISRPQKGKVKISWSKSKAASGYQVCVTQKGKKNITTQKGQAAFPRRFPD